MAGPLAFRPNSARIWASFARRSSAKNREFLESASVQRLWQEHQDGLQDHGQKIWALLSLEVWLRNFPLSKSAAVNAVEMHSA